MKKRDFERITRKYIQDGIDKVLEAKRIKDHTLNKSWIKLTRESLMMPPKVLAKRLNQNINNVYKSEKREVTSRMTLEVLGTFAKAMNCKLVYAFVPDKPIDEMIRDEAVKIARKEIESLSLEHRSNIDIQGLEEELVNELLKGDIKMIWTKSQELD